MDRRKFLTVSGATVTGLAGCVELPSADFDDQFYTISKEEHPEGTPLTHEVELVDDDILSPDSPVTIEVTLTN